MESGKCKIVCGLDGRRKILMGFFGGSDSKESACNGRELGSIPGSGRSPGGGNGNPLQYSCPDREAWWAIVTNERLSLSLFS